MAGYSGTPLPKKLGIKEGSTVGIEGPSPHDLDIATSGEAPYDVLLWFVTAAHDVRNQLSVQATRITMNGGLWVCWPKKAARKIVASDMTEDVVREVALPLGLVDNKVCAVDEVWSGLRVVWRKENRVT